MLANAHTQQRDTTSMMEIKEELPKWDFNHLKDNSSTPSISRSVRFYYSCPSK